ncbi:hypothetical protein OPV22_002616 [Ensete ventricosum]|uniref:Uncharacterized protein n=1 Tax=Ensete ventricosum TaxID=4639 RepID=A0AAV8RYH4_ENSVE|nr:hypothetical protein OPV22_002616 [Ensete ventricosum]
MTVSGVSSMSSSSRRTNIYYTPRSLRTYPCPLLAGMVAAPLRVMHYYVWVSHLILKLKNKMKMRYIGSNDDILHDGQLKGMTMHGAGHG